MQSLSRSGTPSISSRYTAYQIFDKLLSTRAAFIKRSKQARKGIGQQCVQTIPCIELIPVDKDMCPCNPPKGCKWLRSKDPLPKVISLISVTNSAADFNAEFVEWSQFKNKISGRSYDDSERFYTFLDVGTGSYLYLYNEDFLENIAVTGVFEDPTEALTFAGCSKLTKDQETALCNPLDVNVYTDIDLMDTICKATYQYFAATLGPASADEFNDNQENAKGVVNPTT